MEEDTPKFTMEAQGVVVGVGVGVIKAAPQGAYLTTLDPSPPLSDKSEYRKLLESSVRPKKDSLGARLFTRQRKLPFGSNF